MYKVLLIVLSLISLQLNAVIIGKDTRNQIKTIENQYAKKVGQIEAWNNNNPKRRGLCTATNLNRKYIITSAHCIIHQKTNKPYDNIVYYPRRLNMEERSPSRVYIKVGYLMKGYELNSNEFNKLEDTIERGISTAMVAEDLAILEAYSDMENGYVGDVYGYYRHDSFLLEQGEEINVNVSSYPSDKEFSSLWHEGCYITGTDINIGLIECDLVSGASGSSVIYQNKIIGVFSAESPESKQNHVTLITTEMEREINNIIIGEHFANKILKKVEFNTELKNYLYVENKCSQSVTAAILFESTKESGYFLLEDIEPKKISSRVTSTDNTYYYYAESKDYIWDGKDFFGYIFENEGKKGFIKKQKDNYRTGTSYGDWYIELRCY